jgi:transcriptional regulator with XRE-family HTH domain
MDQDLIALLGHDLLAWARTRAGMTREHAADLAGIPHDTLPAWETGQGLPDRAALRRLAELYCTKIGIFFLKEPPLDEHLGRREPA